MYLLATLYVVHTRILRIGDPKDVGGFLLLSFSDSHVRDLAQKSNAF